MSMMMMRPALASAMLLAALSACPASQSSRCMKICQEQVECIEKLGRTDIRIDQNECTSTCTALERDTEGKKRVDAHAACVDKASDCDAKLACP
jgi:hypothetical protein